MVRDKQSAGHSKAHPSQPDKSHARHCRLIDSSVAALDYNSTVNFYPQARETP
jgi:hypothetical protein